MERNSEFKLSPDSVIHVLRYLDPVDILAMRATCRLLYRVASSRAVWLAALDRVCEQHGIYKPTYPMKSMSTAELEHAASGPHRFIRSIKQFHSGPPEGCKSPYFTRRFPCRKRANVAGALDSLHTPAELALVPGGRFLFATSPSAPRTTIVSLWDLGYSPHSHLHPYPIATVSIPDRRPYWISAFHNSRGGNEIVVALLVMPVSAAADTPGQMQIYEIDPLLQVPEFILRDDQPIRADTYPSVYLNEPMVVVKGTGHIHAWNWVEKMGCQWENPRLAHDSEVAVFGSTIIALSDERDILIWDIPRVLPSIEPGNELPVVSLTPKRVLRKHGAAEPYLSATPSWQGDLDVSHFCLVADEEEVQHEEDAVLLYSVRKIGTRDTAFLPTYLPVVAGKKTRMAEDLQPILDPVSPLVFCDGRLVLCTRSVGSDGLIATVFPVPTEASGDSLHLHSALVAQEDYYDPFNPDNVGFCPMSGRVVYPVDHHKALQISDFLLPLDNR